MKKKAGTRFLSLLLSLTLVFSLLPASALAAGTEDTQTTPSTAETGNSSGDNSSEANTPQGEDDTTPAPASDDGAAVTTATISYTAQACNGFLCAPQHDVTVRSDLAESYGLTDGNAGSVTLLDVLVAANLAMDSSITKANISDYIVVSGGYASTAFGMSASTFTFAVNGVQPNDGVFNENWQAYTGYSLTQATVSDGDTVEFAFLQDSTWADNYLQFYSDDQQVSTLNTTAGASVSLTVKGYAIGWYGCSKAETIAAGTAAVANAQLAWVDANGAVTDITGAKTDASGKATFTAPSTAGTYYLTAYTSGTGVTPSIMTLLKVVVASAAETPTSIIVKCSFPYQTADGAYAVKTGDVLQFTAYDQDGKETPVTWSNGSTWNGTIDADGKYTVTTSMTAGSSSTVYVTATSTLDTSVKSEETRTSITGYEFSSYQKNQTVSLPQNGGGKSVSISGGVKGTNTWSYDIPEGVATLSEDPGTGTSVNFTCLRPGTFTATVSAGFDGLDALTDTATITVTGVAVETASGEQGQIRLYQTETDANPTAQLTAYTAEDATVSGWSSSDESVVTVDANGKITAQGVGSAYVYATDSNGTKGGIKVIVGSEITPYFDSFELYANAFTSGQWSTGKTFDRDTHSYDLTFRYYSTSAVTIQATTAYDTDKYTATASYTDINGEEQTVFINSGKSTTLSNIPFGTTAITVTLTSKTDADKQNTYTLNVTRPRDTSKAMKSSGIVLVPDGRTLNTAKYNGYAEGTMFRADETGASTGKTGVTGTVYNYRTYLQEGDKTFALQLSGSTAYSHLRYSTDGENWTELAQGGGTTANLTLPESGVQAVQVQILDDTTYAANIAAGKDGFAEGTPNTYTVWVESVSATASAAQILTAQSDSGDWYLTSFTPDSYTYSIVVPNGTKTGTLTFTAVEGATVKVGSTALTADENGTYTLELSTSAKTVTVTAADGSISNSYSFKLLAKNSANSADKVVDYLCINSQYTNAANYGMNAQNTLAGSTTSLGNFGGYITYYFEDGLTDNANNKYGVDFYVYGNSFSDGGSAAEPGQVWVSEDGETWYALAGSEHYEDSTIWDYTVTYTKTSSGKTAWTDNQGNSKDGSSQTGNWALQTNYPLNKVLGTDSVTLSGILLPSSEDGTIMGSGTTSSYSGTAKFGYADYYKNGTYGTDVNPYTANPTCSNGFDLAWAVDGDGNPVDVSGKSFHYVKVVTASNIWAGAFNEKSTEVNLITRTNAADESVGTTAAPSGVTISGNGQTKTVSFVDGQQIYEVNVGDMSELSIAVNGTSEDDNIYVNNQRIAADGSATGFFVSQSTGEKLVRVIVQNGESAPVIYLLKLTSTSTATESSLITGVTATAQMAGYTTDNAATSEDGENYAVTVDNNVTSVTLKPYCRTGATATVYNAAGEVVTGAQTLEVGDNTFTIVATKGDQQQTATLTVNRKELSGDYITVVFSLLGDDKHGDSTTSHSLSGGNLTTWIAPTTYTVPAESTALDVLEKALTENNMTWTNAGGNYITEVNGLAAFDNGANAGWMFTLNGVYGNYGVQEQPLSDGDTIVFHYTDDWSLEDFSGNAPTPTPDVTDASLEDIYTTTGNYLATNVTDPTSASIGGDWAVLGLARAGYAVSDDYYQTYYNNVAKLVKDADGVLSSNKYTEYSRTILGLTAAGYDPRDMEGYDLTAPLADFDKVVRQGINGPIWALIALDSGNYEIPTVAEGKTQTTRENLVEYILSKQLSDGGWSLSSSAAASDVDVTAMAIQALAPYYESNTDVRRAVDTALNRLSQQQDEKGGFSSSNAVNSQSCAQVVVALTSLGIDPATDSRFVKNGVSVLGALCAYYVTGGGFRNVATDTAANGMATEQGYYALVSYVRYLNQQTTLYDMTDVSVKKGEIDTKTDDKTDDVTTDDTKQDDTTTADQTAASTPTKTDAASGSAKTADTSAPALAFAVLMVSTLGAVVLRKKKAE